MADRIVVMGAGALSLGFLAPELVRDYPLTLIDTNAKAEFIEGLRAEGRYTFNLAGDTIKPICVENVTALNLQNDRDADTISAHMAEARLFFTAVGVRNLDKVLAYVLERLAGRSHELFVLCAENGEDLAARWRDRSNPNTHICDTVMGRMCRLEENPGPDYAAVFPSGANDAGWGVVAEDFCGIPVSTEVARADVFHSDAFEIVAPEEFHAREQIKLFAHNGMHLFIAVSAHLKGMAGFAEAGQDHAIMREARALLHEEIAPALWREHGPPHGPLDEPYFRAYIDRLLPRLVSTTLRDTVARGVRGLPDKFAANERIMGGLALLMRSGIEPNVFDTFIVRALRVAAQSGGEKVIQDIVRRQANDMAERLEGLRQYVDKDRSLE